MTNVLNICSVFIICYVQSPALIKIRMSKGKDMIALTDSDHNTKKKYFCFQAGEEFSFTLSSWNTYQINSTRFFVYSTTILVSQSKDIQKMFCILNFWPVSLLLLFSHICPFFLFFLFFNNNFMKIKFTCHKNSCF